MKKLTGLTEKQIKFILAIFWDGGKNIKFDIEKLETPDKLNTYNKLTVDFSNYSHLKNKNYEESLKSLKLLYGKRRGLTNSMLEYYKAYFYGLTAHIDSSTYGKSFLYLK